MGWIEAQANRAYNAEGVAIDVLGDELDNRRYTVVEAKRMVNGVINSPEWQALHRIAMARFGYTINPNETKVRKGKANGWRAASVRWHTSWDRGLWASIVLNGDNDWPSVTRTTMVHELAHYLVGPRGAHGDAWAGSFVALSRQLVSPAFAEALKISFERAGFAIETEWYHELTDLGA